MNIFKEFLSIAMKLAVLLMGLMLLSAPSQARIKCWENDEGIRECGEKVPPQYSQKGHKTLSKQGLTISKSDRAKTKEEREKEEHLAHIKQQQEVAKAERIAQDNILLDTYSNIDDIQLTADEKIADIESSIRLADKRNKTILNDLERRQKIVADTEKAGRDISPQMLEDISSLERQIKNNEKFIADKQAGQENTKKEYAEKIARFLELKGG